MAFEIDLLPVGSGKKSGDCIAMRYGDLVNGKEKQTVIVVDGGYAGTWKDTLKPFLRKYYNCEIYGKLHIDLVILSHPDQDHVSGLVEMAKDEGWYSKNGSKWQTMEDLMLRYRAATFFGRLYTPDLLMGMQTKEELDDTPYNFYLEGYNKINS